MVPEPPAIAGFELPPPILLLGLIVGLAYALLAIGLVLVYRASRVINLAHGEVGAVAAVALALLVRDHDVPYWAAFAFALVLAAILGALVELTIVRRLFDAPRIVLLVATMGVAQLFLAGTNVLTGAIDNRIGGFPQPFDAAVPVGGLLVLHASHIAILVIAPAAVLGLALFLRRSSTGLAVRAAAESADSARLVGVPVRRLSTLVWALAGVLSAVTGILLSPGKALVATESLGPGLLVRALAAAVVGRMASLPVAFAAGIGLGVVEQLVLWNRPTGGEVEGVLFGVVLVGLLLASREMPRETERSTWRLAHAAKALPRAAAAHPWIRLGGRGLVLVAIGISALLPFLLSNSQTFLLTTIVAFGILALSVTVLTGHAGQLSLGQVAFFGLGAAVSYQLSVEVGLWFWASVGLATAAGAGASVVVGAPALRLRGPFLAVTTLAFALFAQRWLLGQDWMMGVGVTALRPTSAPLDLDSQRGYYLFALAGLLGAIWVTRNLLRGGPGRRLDAVADDEAGAASFGVFPGRTKLTAFAVAGGLAAFAGAVYGHGIGRFGVGNFPVADGLRVVAMGVIGGLASIPGTISGVVFVLGIDRLLHVPFLGLLVTSVGLLVLLLFFPGGFAGLAATARERLAKTIVSGVDRDPTMALEAEVSQRFEALPQDLPEAPRPSHEGAGTGGPSLEISDLTVDFDGLRALDDVNLSVPNGAILGIVGPNGAGKTTLIDCVSGFIRSRSGRILFHGTDVTPMGPADRARLGIVRSFQEGRLFESLTVVQTLLLAQERSAPSSLAAVALGAPSARRTERTKLLRARATAEALGLSAGADALVGELSMGTRRVVELASVALLRPRLLLLDEPTAGLAEAESRVLGHVLRRLRDLLRLTMIVVEHDHPLVFRLADEIVAMESGRVVQRGTPADLRGELLVEPAEERPEAARRAPEGAEETHRL